MSTIALTADEARRMRVSSQGLDVGVDSRKSVDVVGIVRRTGGIQAQDVSAGALQVRARSFGLTYADVVFALSESRSIVRTWAMRGTLHLIPSEDHRWLTDLLGPAAFSAGSGRRLQMGLDEKTLERALECLVKSFTKYGPLTRKEVGKRLVSEGIRVEGQAVHHVVRSGGFLGVIAHGPLLDGKTETFVAADSWLAGIERPELSRDEALARLAGRYFRAFGPSTERDFSVWSGLPLRDARAGFEAISGELVEVEVHPHPNPPPSRGRGSERMWVVDGGSGPAGQAVDSGLRRNDGGGRNDDKGRNDGGGLALRQAQGERGPVVRLLGFFDTYLLGYRGRGLAVAPEYMSRVNAGGGMIRPVVTIDGLAVATWSWRWVRGGSPMDSGFRRNEGSSGRNDGRGGRNDGKAGRGLEISVEAFPGMEGALGSIWDEARGEVGDIGRFLGVEAGISPPP
ncbi:MAG: winged helix DNA-binding domain-containing protein [Chloroflexi bacterium]|nr:winged helix DNA-binding domain-containing protein [Chloroflexota bacterium]